MSDVLPVKRGVGEPLHGDVRRVVLKRFFTFTVAIAERIVRQVGELSDAEADATLKRTIDIFDERHENLRGRFLHRFAEIRATLAKR
jgi:hypothetical protein